MQCCHVQRGPAVQVLDIRVRPCLDEQLHAQGPMVGEGSVVQWRLAFVVEGIEADVVLEENIHNSVLSVVTCHMEGSSSMCVHSIRLYVVCEGGTCVGGVVGKNGGSVYETCAQLVGDF